MKDKVKRLVAHAGRPVAAVVTRRTARRYFTPEELTAAEVRGRRLAVADAEFRLVLEGGRPTLELVTTPEDAWLRELLSTIDGDQLIWETVAFLKVRRLSTPDEVVQKARSGELYDESYFTKRGGGAPYVGYPLEYNGYAGSAPRIADELIRVYAPDRVLDVGCATGVLVRELEQRGAKAAGIDLSTWAVDNAVTESVVLGSAMKLPWDDSSFDVVFSQDFMEHIHPDDLPHVLAEQVRVVRPSGVIIHLIPFYPFEAPAQIDAHLCEASRQWWLELLSSVPNVQVSREPDESADELLGRMVELRPVKQLADRR
jgi:SAM-dependent methyltransferase